MGVDFLPVPRAAVIAALRGAPASPLPVPAALNAPRPGPVVASAPVAPASATPAARPAPQRPASVPLGAPTEPADPPVPALPALQPSLLPAHAEFKPLPRLDAQRAAQWLDRLRARYEADAPHKQFVTDHHNIVFGEGDPLARLMFVGEAPGAEEDRTGRPFVGRAGQLLDKMITAMGLDRSRVYIANVLKTRPPDNATPTLQEAAACAPYLFEQIAIIRPEVIVTLGLPATRLLLSTTASMSNLRGRWAPFQIPRTLPHPDTHPDLDASGVGAIVPVMPTFHPAFLLRSYTKENRQKVWSDLQQVVDRLGLKPAAASAPD